MKRVAPVIGIILSIYLCATVLLGMYWSIEPDLFEVKEEAEKELQEVDGRKVPGYATAAAVIHMVETLLNKPGGYITNDVFPPGLWMDNMPRWEFGVLVQVRDIARALRKDISRAQSQSAEDRDLVIAEPQFNFDSDSYMLPATEDEYKTGLRAMNDYLNRLSQPGRAGAQFYARADNLRGWLTDVETRLGSLAQRLSESVGKVQYDTGMVGERSAAGDQKDGEEIRTPWLEIDDVFFEARGTTWALYHILKAIEIDFQDVLRDKNAVVSLQQIISDLEATQDTVWSPLILNGSGFGMLANHSLTMASYISRVNAAIIDLRLLLQQG